MKLHDHNHRDAVRGWSFAFNDLRLQFVHCFRVTGIFLLRQQLDRLLELSECDLASSVEKRQRAKHHFATV